MLTTRADLEALLGAVLWTQRTNPNLTGAMRARLTDIENRLMDGITHVSAPSQSLLVGRAGPARRTAGEDGGVSHTALPTLHHVHD